MIAARLRALRERIQQKSVNGYLVTHPVDQYYLTGFDGEDGAVLVLPGRVYLLTDGRFAEEASRAAGWALTVVREGSLLEVVSRVVRRHRIKRLGFQPEALSVSTHIQLRRSLRPARLVSMPGILAGLRTIKDSFEVSAMQRAVRVAESGFRAMLKRIRIGMTEGQLADLLQHEMVVRGASGASFPIIVASGSNSSLPHAKSGARKIRSGSAVLIDWGATVDHYRSDLTRVIFIRRIPPRFRRMYETVLLAQQAALGSIGPGVRMCEVDSEARSVLKGAGMDHLFVHGLGHGLGLEVHEWPRLAKKVTEPLAAGMVVTVEPGVYRPGIGGVRIEDDVLVTEKGCRVLSRLSKDLDDMVL
jgi:Xaa-Pro aminopeptidase